MSKSLHKTVLAGILALALILGSCVDEPTIAPVKIPFAMMRFGNLLANVDNIDVYVDGERVASNISQNHFSEFMKVTSVKRNIERFPSHFMFQLSTEEYDLLRSQIVTLSEWGEVGEKADWVY